MPIPTRVAGTNRLKIILLILLPVQQAKKREEKYIPITAMIPIVAEKDKEIVRVAYGKLCYTGNTCALYNGFIF